MDDTMTIKKNDGKTVISNDLPRPQSIGVRLVFVHKLKNYLDYRLSRNEYKTVLTTAGASDDFARLFVDRLYDGGEHETIDS